MYNCARYLQFLMLKYFSRAGMNSNGFRHELRRPRDNFIVPGDDPPSGCRSTARIQPNTPLPVHMLTSNTEKELRTRRSGTVSFGGGRWFLDYSVLAFVNVSVTRNSTAECSHCLMTWGPSKPGSDELILKVSTLPNDAPDGQGVWRLLMRVSMPDTRPECQIKRHPFASNCKHQRKGEDGHIQVFSRSISLV